MDVVETFFLQKPADQGQQYQKQQTAGQQNQPASTAQTDCRHKAPPCKRKMGLPKTAKNGGVITDGKFMKYYTKFIFTHVDWR